MERIKPLGKGFKVDIIISPSYHVYLSLEYQLVSILSEGLQSVYPSAVVCYGRIFFCRHRKLRMGN